MESTSNDNHNLSSDSDDEEVLSKEKKSLLSFISDNPSFLPETLKVCQAKSAEKSIKYRKKGHEIFVKNKHGQDEHNTALQMFTKSIAFAPNNSLELGLGYGSRALLLFHVKEYEECIKDCDIAMSTVISSDWKIRLLRTKAESLFLLNKPVVDACNESLSTIKSLNVDEKLKKDYIIRIGKILIAGCTKKVERKVSAMKSYEDELLSFPRSKQIPCASNSVTVKYNSEWGNHIVARKSIQPGDIIAVEKNLAMPYDDGCYILCSCCFTRALHMVPCENCVYALYCSDSCRKNAWVKYHQFECPFIYTLQNICEDDLFDITLLTTKIVLSAVHDAGGIEKLKDEVVNVLKCKDPQLLKFPKDISDSVNTLTSILNMNEYPQDSEENKNKIRICCTIVYLLNRKTNFFGKKKDISMSQLFASYNRMFIACVLLKIIIIARDNMDYLYFTYKDDEVTGNETAHGIKILKSYINHSCNPNVDVVEANSLYVLYARNPIKKGEQLFVSYGNYNFVHSKDEREEFLSDIFRFKCKCIACTEDWSSICMPSLEEIVWITPALETTYRKLKILEPIVKHNTKNPKLLKDVIHNMKLTSKEITTHCDNYQKWADLVGSHISNIFCYFTPTNISDTCTLSGDQELFKAISYINIV